MTFTWLDGTKVKCKSKCGEAGDPVRECLCRWRCRRCLPARAPPPPAVSTGQDVPPTLALPPSCPLPAADEVNFFDPNTGRWSAKNALAPMNHPRMYHASAILLPDCRVMMAGSDVTKDITAEIFTPPHLSLGPRPVITWAPDAIIPGATLTLRFASQEPVVKALLLRTGAATHSMFFGASLGARRGGGGRWGAAVGGRVGCPAVFLTRDPAMCADARALWLTIVAQANGVIILQLPPNYNVLPPGM